ncbi:MAG: hypothetical protein KBC38_00905 [Candidatus Pacebacteria bacterium]|nr:hypothetical protein [Candidatus Paceibacterota bacterium]MBP9840198.1 hypothetical protein [Candidatus Paceibacterota bacterium]
MADATYGGRRRSLVGRVLIYVIELVALSAYLAFAAGTWIFSALSVEKDDEFRSTARAFVFIGAIEFVLVAIGIFAGLTLGQWTLFWIATALWLSTGVLYHLIDSENEPPAGDGSLL